MKKFNIRKNLLMLVDVVLIALSALVSGLIVSLVCVVFKLPAEKFVVNDIRLTWIVFLNALFCFFSLYVCGAYNKVWRDFSKKDYVYCSVGVAVGLLLS